MWPLLRRFNSSSSLLSGRRVKLVEVGPRDGLQNEKDFIRTDDKITFIHLLRKAGLKDIEATSCVSPSRIPQLADSSKVLEAIRGWSQTTNFSVLVPNMRGYAAAVAGGAKTVAVFTAASETFNKRNVNCSVDESFEKFEPVFSKAREDEVRVRGYVSCVLGCPYEGHVKPSAVARVTSRLLEAGCYEVSLGDTIGVGTAGSTVRLLEEVVGAVGTTDSLAVHFHNTYGQALVNILVALERGIAIVDSSVAGLGGCPYAPGASGNVATEDVLYLLEGLGIETGVDMEKLLEAAKFISKVLGRPPVSNVGRAQLGPSLCL